MQHSDIQRQRRENQPNRRFSGRQQPRRDEEWRTGEFPASPSYDDRIEGSSQFDPYQQDDGRYAADQDWDRGGQDPRYSVERSWENQDLQDYPQQGYPDWQQPSDLRDFDRPGNRGIQNFEPRRQSGWRPSSFERDGSRRPAWWQDRNDSERFGHSDDGRYGMDTRTSRFGSGLGESQTEPGSATSYRGRGPKGYQRSKEQIIDDASQRLEWDSRIDASEIELEYENGVLTLEGSVETREQKRHAEACVESVRGVTDVMNKLRVESQRTSSDEKQSRNDGRSNGENRASTEKDERGKSAQKRN